MSGDPTIPVELVDVREHSSRSPERPHFFSGQLLTEDDLDALLRWATGRFERAARRVGEGVVDGLGLEFDPDQPLTIRVTPGVAIDSGGREIVVPDTKEVRLPMDLFVGSRATGPREIRREFSGLPIELHVARPFLLLLRYSEQQTTPRPRLVHDDGDARTFDYGRTLEGSRLELAVDVGKVDATRDAREWEARFEACEEVVAEFRARFGTRAGQSDAIHEWLRQWIDRKPVHAFKVVSQLVRSAAPEPDPDEPPLFEDEATVARLLLFLVLDRRLAMSTRTKRDVEQSDGSAEDPHVVLGRVWVSDPESDERQPRILGVDPDPRLRGGPLAERSPAPVGLVNLSSLFWAPAEDGARLLAEHGMRMAYEEPLGWPDGLDWFDNWLGQSPFASPWDEVIVQTIDTGEFGRRIVGYRVTGAGKRTGLALRKTVRPERASPGQTLEYVFELENTGRTPHTVRLVDDDLGVVEEALRLLPRQSVERRVTFTLPTGAAFGPHRSTSIARVRGDSGDELERSVESTVEILDPRDTAFEPRIVPLSSWALWFSGRPRYRVEVANTGRLPLNLTLRWALLGTNDTVIDEVVLAAEGRRPVAFERGAQLRWSRTVEVAMTGTHDDGRSMSQSLVLPLPATFDVAAIAWGAVPALGLTATAFATTVAGEMPFWILILIGVAWATGYRVWRFNRREGILA